MKKETAQITESVANQVGAEQIICKNCEHHYQGNYCPACGQSKFSFDRPLRFLIVDFAGNLFAFDTRLWRSLITIFFKPGKMEVEYTAGKRKKYMSPFRFYIFFSFFFFLLMAYTVNKEVRTLNFVIAETPEKVANNEKDKNTISFPADITNAKEIVDFKNSLGNISTIEGEAIKSITLDDIRNNPDKYFSRFVKYVSWAMFFLMPLYAFLLWLLFRKSLRYYFGHLILSLNHHVLIFTMIIIIILAGMIFGGNAAGYASYLLFLIPVYIVVGAKRLYKKRWVSTALRVFLAWFFYSFVSIIVTGSMLLLAVLA